MRYVVKIESIMTKDSNAEDISGAKKAQDNQERDNRYTRFSTVIQEFSDGKKTQDQAKNSIISLFGFSSTDASNVDKILSSIIDIIDTKPIVNLEVITNAEAVDGAKPIVHAEAPNSATKGLDQETLERYFNQFEVYADHLKEKDGESKNALKQSELEQGRSFDVPYSISDDEEIKRQKPTVAQYEVPHSIAGEDDKNLRPLPSDIQPPRVIRNKNTNSIDIESSYQAAIEDHEKGVPFETLSDQTKDGIRTVTFVDPRLSPEEKKDPKNHVVYTFDKLGQLSIDCGKEVSCDMPPQKRVDGQGKTTGFEQVRVLSGKPGYIREEGVGSSKVITKVEGKVITQVEMQERGAAYRSAARSQVALVEMERTNGQSNNVSRAQGLDRGKSASTQR
jgi:hypothetical protein